MKLTAAMIALWAQLSILFAVLIVFRRELRSLPRKLAHFARYTWNRVTLRGRFAVVETHKQPLAGLRGGSVVAQTLIAREEVRPASADLGALALALGHSPERHRLEILAGQWPSLRVLDAGTGKPVRTYTFKSLERRGKHDANFAAAWAMHAEALS